MLRVLAKQLAIVILAASLAGGAGADTEAEGVLKLKEGFAAYRAEDYAVALRKYLEAAELGNASAQNSLGLMYHYGVGVPQNYIEAEKWYRLAVEQGFAEAQYFLGGMYANGQGVPQNGVMAYVWFSLAAAQGSEAGRIIRDISASQLTPEQLARGQEIAARCFASDYKDCK